MIHDSLLTDPPVLRQQYDQLLLVCSTGSLCCVDMDWDSSVTLLSLMLLNSFHHNLAEKNDDDDDER